MPPTCPRVRRRRQLQGELAPVTYCHHCVLACPNDALEPDETDFDRFQEGLARVTAVFLEEFEPEDVLYINFLTDITIFCDCWGLSKPSLVPDIGIMAGRNAEKRGTAQSPAPRQW